MTRSCHHCRACKQCNALEDRDDSQRQNRPPPLAIRQQLNLRLQNGEPAQDLLSWLNRLPEGQAILAAHFAAKPIDASNLSHWKQGGYLDMRKQQRIRQILGFGADYGSEAAPESLLPPKPEPN